MDHLPPDRDDYVSGSFNVSLQTGKVKVTLSMTTLTSKFVEDDEYFKATLSLPVIPGAVVVGSPEVAFVTITDTTRKLWFTSWAYAPLKMNS